MKRHPILIPISREHHPMLMLAQLLKADAPPYKNLPVTIEGKAEHAQKEYKRIVQVNLQRDLNCIFPFLISLRAEQWPEVQELRNLCINLLNSFDHLEDTTSAETLNNLALQLESYVRIKERALFEKMQATLSEEDFIQLKEKLSLC